MKRLLSQVIVCLVVVGIGGFCEVRKAEAVTAPKKKAAAVAQAGGPVVPQVGDPVFKVPLTDAPLLGEAGAPVTLVEISDYQCPFSARGNLTVEALRTKYGAQLRVAMIQNPLPFHDHAQQAALAALAAGQQGKFWEMHSTLFLNQSALGEEDLLKYAAELGLDVAKFKADLGSDKLKQVVQRDLALAQKVGAKGTPTFFINGRRVVGAQPVEVLSKVVDQELSHARSLVSAGTAPERVYGVATAGGLEADPQGEPRVDEGACNHDPSCNTDDLPAEPSAPENVEVGTAPTRGPVNAPVTIVMFSDFQCPFCSRAAATLRELDKAYPGQIRFAFKQRPLPFHEHANLAARAALAAGDQGKFWETSTIQMFAHQDKLDAAGLDELARGLGLDLERFRTTRDSGAVGALVAADNAQADALTVRGTPTFFVNGRRLTGAQPLATFKAAVDAALK